MLKRENLWDKTSWRVVASVDFYDVTSWKKDRNFKSDKGFFL